MNCKYCGTSMLRRTCKKQGYWNDGHVIYVCPNRNCGAYITVYDMQDKKWCAYNGFNGERYIEGDIRWMEKGRSFEKRKKWDYCAKSGCDCDLPKVCTNSNCNCGRPKMCVKSKCNCSWRKGCTDLNCDCGRPKVYL